MAGKSNSRQPFITPTEAVETILCCRKMSKGTLGVKGAFYRRGALPSLRNAGSVNATLHERPSSFRRRSSTNRTVISLIRTFLGRRRRIPHSIISTGEKSNAKWTIS